MLVCFAEYEREHVLEKKYAECRAGSFEIIFFVSKYNVKKESFVLAMLTICVYKNNPPFRDRCNFLNSFHRHQLKLRVGNYRILRLEKVETFFG